VEFSVGRGDSREVEVKNDVCWFFSCEVLQSFKVHIFEECADDLVEFMAFFLVNDFCEVVVRDPEFCVFFQS